MSFRWPTFGLKPVDTDSDDSEVERINNSAPVPEELEEKELEEKELEEVEMTPAVEPPSATNLCFDDIQKNISSVINDLEALREPEPASDETKEVPTNKEKDQEPLITNEIPEKVEPTFCERFTTWAYSLKSYFCFCLDRTSK